MSRTLHSSGAAKAPSGRGRSAVVSTRTLRKKEGSIRKISEMTQLLLAPVTGAARHRRSPKDKADRTPDKGEPEKAGVRRRVLEGGARRGRKRKGDVIARASPAQSPPSPPRPAPRPRESPRTPPHAPAGWDDEESLDDEEFMAILTCPSPVWWEDPPDDYEEALAPASPRGEGIPPHKQCDVTFMTKRSKLEHLLGNIRNKAAPADAAPTIAAPGQGAPTAPERSFNVSQAKLTCKVKKEKCDIDSDPSKNSTKLEILVNKCVERLVKKENAVDDVPVASASIICDKNDSIVGSVTADSHKVTFGNESIDIKEEKIAEEEIKIEDVKEELITRVKKTSESTEGDPFIGFNNEELLQDLENMDIPIKTEQSSGEESQYDEYIESPIVTVKSEPNQRSDKDFIISNTSKEQTLIELDEMDIMEVADNGYAKNIETISINSINSLAEENDSTKTKARFSIVKIESLTSSAASAAESSPACVAKSLNSKPSSNENSCSHSQTDEENNAYKEENDMHKSDFKDTSDNKVLQEDDRKQIKEICTQSDMVSRKLNKAQLVAVYKTITDNIVKEVEKTDSTNITTYYKKCKNSKRVTKEDVNSKGNNDGDEKDNEIVTEKSIETQETTDQSIDTKIGAEELVCSKVSTQESIVSDIVIEEMQLKATEESVLTEKVTEQSDAIGTAANESIAPEKATELSKVSEIATKESAAGRNETTEKPKDTEIATEKPIHESEMVTEEADDGKTFAGGDAEVVMERSNYNIIPDASSAKYCRQCSSIFETEWCRYCAERRHKHRK